MNAPVLSKSEIESKEEALQHLQFQMSLLRLTALPGQERGAEAIPLEFRQKASTADLLLEEMHGQYAQAQR